jgi:uncharacterized protein (TIGR02996 family)
MGAVATDTGTGLLQAILQEPDDDALRLIYADWVQDHGDPDRAEFIRLQCERLTLASVSWFSGLEICLHDAEGKACYQCQDHKDREEELLAANAARWHPRGRARWTFRRGFIEAAGLTWTDWTVHAAALLADTPLRSVTLLTMPPVRSQWLIDGHGLEFTADWSPRRAVIAPEVSSRQSYQASVRQAVLDMLAWRWPDLTFHLPEG